MARKFHEAAGAAGADPDPSTAPGGQDPDRGDPAALGDPGKRALERLKAEKAREKARADAAEAKVREHADAQLTDAERRDQAIAELTRERDELRRAQLTREVADTKGLTPAQARWLQGADRDELEANADELLASFPAAAAPPPPADPTPKVPSRPVEAPRGGGTPDDPPDEMNPRKLAEAVPRR